jgi:hypothetical protein
MNSMLSSFIGGANTFGFLLIALFFAKFWKRTRDPFFGTFALAFLVLGIGRIVEAGSRMTHASTPAVYVLRLLAFSIIIFAIAQKNMGSTKT